MRLKNEYTALISKINIKKTNYSEKEMVVSNELEHDILITYEKKKKFTIWLLVSTALLGILMGIIYDFLDIINTRWAMWIVIGVCLAAFLVVLSIQLFYTFKLKSLNKKKLKEDSEKNEVKNDIISLNDQISSLVLSVIVLNEHFYELRSIEDSEQREEKWQKYVKEHLMAINTKYDYRPTYTEFEEYYHNYESFMEELENR